MEKIANVFAVDDNDTFLAQVNTALKPHFNVLTASSGARMFAMFEKVKPDIIVLDIEMPGMDGFEVLSRLKGNPEHAGIPVMFLTGVQDATLEARALSAGVVDFVEKPFTAPILVNRINLHLNLAEMKRSRRKPMEIPPPERKTIFAVDDNDTFLSQMDDALKNHYNVVTISSGTKVFELIEKITPHLIVLDIEMPEMDGFQVLSRLKAEKRLSNIPVIFLSGMQDESMENRAFSAGVADFIQKPFTTPILSNRIHLHIFLRELRKR